MDSHGCSAITKVILPDTLKEIGDTAFLGCNELQEINIPKSVKKIGNNTFARCKKLKTVKIEGKIEEFGNYVFQDCESLENINIPTSVKTIGQCAFEGTKIKNVNIPNATNVGVLAFADCSLLENITLSEELEIIENGMLQNCKNLKSIEIPNKVKEIGGLAFSGCTSLKTLVLPGNLTLISNAFTGCTGLEDVTISEGIETIGNSMFEGCTSIKKIILPESVKTVDYGTFKNCTGLEEVYFSKNVTDIYSNAFEGCDYEKLTFYGYTGTRPQSFATTYNINFVALDEEQTENEDAELEEGTVSVEPDPELKDNTILDEETKIELKAKLEKAAKLKVEKIKSDSSIVKEMLKGLKNYKILASYDVSIIGKYEGDIQVTFNLGKDNNGKTATILHKKSDGTVEKFEQIIKNGKVTVTVSELSPFVVTISTERTKDAGTPKTGVTDVIPVVFTVLAVSTLGLAVAVRKKEN